MGTRPVLAVYCALVSSSIYPKAVTGFFHHLAVDGLLLDCIFSFNPPAGANQFYRYLRDAEC